VRSSFGTVARRQVGRTGNVSLITLGRKTYFRDRVETVSGVHQESHRVNTWTISLRLKRLERRNDYLQLVLKVKEHCIYICTRSSRLKLG
jgi:hypothetical protein